MESTVINISASSETGTIGVMHLKRYWEKCQLKKSGKITADAFAEEWNIDISLLAVLGLGLEQTLVQVYNASCNFTDFENWVLAVNENKLATDKIGDFNNYIHNRETVCNGDNIEKVLSKEDLEFWKENGYIIIREAISKPDCEDTIAAICDFIEIKRDDPFT